MLPVMVPPPAGSVRRAFMTILLASLGACTMFEDDYRRTLNLLDADFTPDSTAGKVALAPIALPVGLLAFVADAVIVHPITCIDDAWLDTVELLWDSEDETTLRWALMTPISALATPLVFAGDLLVRWTLPLSQRGGDE